MEEEGRICNVPHDVLLKTHIVFDIGWEDSMAIGMIQKRASEIRIIDYIEDSHRTLADYSKEMQSMTYNWGRVWLPYSDGFSKDVKTGLGSDQIMRQLGWDVADKDAVANMSVEDGIKATRLMFDRLYIDKSKCARLIESLKRYRRHISKTTETATTPLHDEYCHGADMLRYACVNINAMHNETIGSYTPKRERRIRRA
jgi:phage terminase large subunit